MKRLLLIAPLSKNSLMGGNFFFRMPSLGLLKVAALTPPSWQLELVDERVENLDLEQPADLVGISTMTTTVARGYEIAEHFRRRGIKVVMGGMHVSCLPQEALQHCDSVVVAEAEGLWPQLLKDWESNQLKALYQHSEELPPLRGLPQPDWALYRRKNYLPVHFVETTRGCPIDCEFCSVTSAFGGRYRNRPIKEVLGELEGLKPFEGRFSLKNCVFFVDDNIISNRTYAQELLSRITGMGFQWFGQASLNIAQDVALLKLCKKSGCRGLFMGFESLSAQTLAAAGKRVNHPEHYLEVVQRIHEQGIGIDGSFVFGFDTDTEAVFERTVEFVQRAKLEVAYFSILTPYPGTRLYKRLAQEGRILSRDWSLYDSNHVVFQPRELSPEALSKGYLEALKHVYTLPSILHRLWGTTAWKNLFYPMNLGFRHSVNKLARHALSAS